MTDLKFEQKRSLSRLEAAHQLTALADALRQGGDAELELEPWTLSLRVPSDLHSEIEVEVDDGEIELEIELKWSISPDTRSTASKASEAAKAEGTDKAGGTEKAGGRRRSATAGSGGTRAGGGRTAKRTAAKKS
ncbi:amphi-Trp domain-containing protein [Streptomyces sp. NPDC008086]|uniref:amphi-Trp domain-containing protein n=1 Tax=Streptomyces sp. NPDC008086 TaxID=3364807 RepID=UPI0036EECB19